ncbi:MAG: beta-lactamase family protein [Desulfobacterales bacterium]|nr:beta-lactamase family protein [Desulfobacterales bacterium]
MKNISELKQEMERGVADGVFPGAVLLWAESGKIMFHGAVGAFDQSGIRKVEPSSVYDLASLTKPLATTLAVAELIGDGRFKLSSPLSELIPGVDGTDKARITVDMLLRHTSGLPAHREYFKEIVPGDPDARNLLRQMILSEPLDSVPGEKEVYSDLGFMLLAWVVEMISGNRLDHFIRERIYSPLGLEGLFFNDLNAQEKSVGFQDIVPTSRCAWRGKLMAGEVEDENAWVAGGIEGHAGLFGDALSVYILADEILRALRNDRPRILKPEVMQAFVERLPGMTRVAGFDTPSGENSSAGKGFPRHGIGHLGFTGTSLWMAPETGRVVVLLSNRVHPSRDNWKIRKFRPRIHDKIHDLASSNSNTNIQV